MPSIVNTEKELDIIESSLTKFLAWIDANGLTGFDPYDALNTDILCVLSFNRKTLRIAYTQILKRIPWNVRKVIGTKTGINPKGVGVLASSYIRLYNLTAKEEFLSKANVCLRWLKDNYVKGYSGCCWGYNFDWQSRAFFLPKGVPTIVNTAFIADAFLDLYQLNNSQENLDIARSSCEFIINDLNIYENNGLICFSYTPIDRTQVYNASLLGARLLSRVYSYTGESHLLDLANHAVDFVIGNQNADGSWYYGNSEQHKWIDGYHTGFVLESLYDYIQYSGRLDLFDPLARGLKFYKDKLFTAHAIPKFRDDCIYPIDIHCCAQGIITFSRLDDIQPESISFAKNIANWTLKNMQDSNGYFYFQKNKSFTNKIPYIRWGQAWMLNALSNLLTKVARCE